MVNITVPDEIASALSAQANSQGLSIEAFLANVVHVATPQQKCYSPDEVEALLDSVSVPGPVYTGTYSRSEIYSDHD